MQMRLCACLILDDEMVSEQADTDIPLPWVKHDPHNEMACCISEAINNGGYTAS